MPRTSKYTPELIEQIVRLIEAGTYAVDACMAVGIHEDTYYHWLKTKSEFSESIKKARAKAINVRLIRIHKAGQEGYWQADAWWLERVARDRFGRYPSKAKKQTHVVLGFKAESAFIQPVDSSSVMPRKIKPQLPRKRADLNRQVLHKTSHGRS